MSEYECVQKGGLKLKKGSVSSDSEAKKKKKKKKEHDKFKQILQQEVQTGGDSSCDSAGPSGSNIRSKRASGAEYKTKAELAFEKVKDQRAVKAVLTQAPKSHKERIMEFNQYLDNLSEHYDIPKVSWTK